MNIYKAITTEVLVPIHPAGWPFIFIFVVASILITVFWSPFALPGTLLSLWCVYFFRNPVRTTPVTDNLIIAPADGRVLSTGIAPAPADLDLPDGEWRRVAIFMNVFDVHVNRAPVAGRVTATSYHAGTFLNASLDKAAEANERQNIVMETASGQAIGIVQIAGLVARRILLEAGVGDQLAVGQQFGIIRFGSRVDVWISADTPVLVMEGQRTVAGETVLADMSGGLQEPGESRRA
ncbi:MAG: phosphatidylserine decarboxylase [SAR116 cluster bacterium]|jgi:phosphatidylserine decarboxylase|nr:MAG: phosphatidylserine decarboxylase [SAR116 cluster bacterium]